MLKEVLLALIVAVLFLSFYELYTCSTRQQWIVTTPQYHYRYRNYSSYVIPSSSSSSSSPTTEPQDSEADRSTTDYTVDTPSTLNFLDDFQELSMQVLPDEEQLQKAAENIELHEFNLSSWEGHSPRTIFHGYTRFHKLSKYIPINKHKGFLVYKVSEYVT